MKVKNQPPAPMWPWGGPRSVRERLVQPSQLDRKKRKKSGDPRAPPLASAELLDFIGPAHSSDELRLPMPPSPHGHDADMAAFSDSPHLESAAQRAEEGDALLAPQLAHINAPPERLERLKQLLSHEARMLSVVRQLTDEVSYIQRRRRDEQKEQGY